MKRLLVCIALLAACKSPPAPSTFGVNVTLDASSLSSATRNEVASAALSVTGDETYSRTFDIRSAISTGQVRFRYIPGIHSGTLTLVADALAPDGTVVGHSSSATVTLSAGHSVAATLTLAPGSSDDLGSAPDGGDDGGMCSPGFHSCGGACVDDRSIDHCSTSCSSCPVTANATAATCDGTSCGVDCQMGYHVCGGACTSSTDASSCNMSCTPCTPPIGGTATCDATSCGGACPSGQKLCLGACIATNMACSGTCPSGTHDCSGNCFDDTSVNSCGSSCTPCPVPANASMATCTAGSCGFVCNNGYKQCGNGCIPSTACCTNSDCAQPTNGVATCDTASHTCVIACNSNYTKCGSECIALSACCVNSDCPPPTNGTATCNASHACVSMCNAPNNTICGTTCVDTTSDNNNCGSCGTVCSAGQCTLSRCVVVLASSQNSPFGIAVDSSGVYWANYADFDAAHGSIMKVATSGGGLTTLASSQVDPSLVAIDANAVYWTEPTVFGTGVINKVAKTGGNVTTVASSQYSPNGISVDGSNVYFSNSGYMSTMGNVNQVPVGGGTVTPLATAKSCSVVIPYSGYVYWPDGNGALMRTPIGGGTTVQIASGSITSVSTDGTNLYWTNGGTGTDGDVEKMIIGGTTPTPLVSNLKYPRGILADAGSVYWLTGDNQIMKVGINGGGPTMVTAGPASAFAVDSTSIYWTYGGMFMVANSGSVSKATPK